MAMSKYTTGEIAKLCGVSVRTVQYYDSRNLLVPSELSEGGRRLYNDNDLKMMRIICFLREAGLPINSISELLAEDNPKDIISVLLEQQEADLKEEVQERQKQLEMIHTIKREMKDLDEFSVESIGDIAQIMKSKAKLKKLRITLAAIGIPITALAWASVISCLFTGKFWLLAVAAAVFIPFAIWATFYYFTRVAYICPHCHKLITPSFREAILAHHTPRMRRLTCPECKRTGLCIEVYAEKELTSRV